MFFLGPDTWPHNTEFPSCAGEFQSPINIIDEETIYDDSLKPFNFSNLYEYIFYNCSNNGHTGRIFFKKETLSLK